MQGGACTGTISTGKCLKFGYCMNFPGHAVVDWNPSGLSIFSIYKHGSPDRRESHCLPDLQWLAARAEMLHGVPDIALQVQPCIVVLSSICSTVLLLLLLCCAGPVLALCMQPPFCNVALIVLLASDHVQQTGTHPEEKGTLLCSEQGFCKMWCECKVCLRRGP